MFITIILLLAAYGLWHIISVTRYMLKEWPKERALRKKAFNKALEQLRKQELKGVAK